MATADFDAYDSTREAVETVRDQLEHIERMADVAIAGFGKAPEGVWDALVDARAAARSGLEVLAMYEAIGEPA